MPIKEILHLIDNSTGGSLRKTKDALSKLNTSLSRKIFGLFSTRNLEGIISKHIPNDFEILFVHSSMDSIQKYHSGSVFDILEMLNRIVGEKRTLAMPSFFFGGQDGDMFGWFQKNPLFDVRRTPSQMGILTEIFRRQSVVVRSLHPTHSVCAKGVLADELVANHNLADTTFGKGTPYDFMASRKTLIL